jgi:hypothetical protein
VKFTDGRRKHISEGRKRFFAAGGKHHMQIHPDRKLTQKEISARYWAKKDPAKKREEHLRNRKRFWDAKNKQYEAQNGICTLCGRPLPPVAKCHWDHNHQTKKYRDVLHRRCNIALGYIEDELHELALAYLEKHSDAA